jgi:hypothetical protein
MTWYIVGISVASFIAFLLLISIICCIVACYRRRKKVMSIIADDHSDSSSNKGDETPDSAMRLPGGPGNLINNLSRNIGDVSDNIPPPYGHSSSANPNDLTMLTN